MGGGWGGVGWGGVGGGSGRPGAGNGAGPAESAVVEGALLAREGVAALPRVVEPAGSGGWRGREK